MSNNSSEVENYSPTDQENGNVEEKYFAIKKTISNYSIDKEEQALNYKQVHRNALLNLLKKTLTIFAIMGSFSLLIFSIYWGSLNDKEKHMNKVKILVVVEDEGVISDNIWDTVTSNDILADWHVYRHSDFMVKHGIVEEAINRTVIEEVHTQKYWISLFVAPNSSAELTQSMTQGSQHTFNFTQHVTVTFESGRDNININSVMLPAVQQVEKTLKVKMLNNVIPELTTSNSASRYMVDTSFNYLDYRPFPKSVLMAPLQIGMIFILLLTFFQFNFFAPVYAETGKVIGHKNMLKYKLLVTWVSYLFLSLIFSFISLAFQIDFTVTFGKAGFVVYWMTTFLMMLALGGAIDNAVSFLIVTFPPLISFWLLFWIISNVSPTFTPMALTNNFYRYGYAWPGHNGMEIYKVILLNLYKGHMGYNYGVLVAWIVVNHALFPFVQAFVGKQMKRSQ